MIAVVMLKLSMRGAREGKRMPVVVGGPSAAAVNTVILTQQ